MGKDFNALRDWLDIPIERQPPSLYELLGLDDFESDREAINKAAARQIARLNAFKRGTRAQRCRELIRELEHARKCLLNPRLRGPYNAALHAERLQSAQAGRTPPPSIPPDETAPVDSASYRAIRESELVDNASAEEEATLLRAGTLLPDSFVVLASLGETPFGESGKAASAQGSGFVEVHALTPELSAQYAELIATAPGPGAVKHENIIPATHLWEHGDRLLLATRLLEGQTLAEWIEQHGPVNIVDALNTIASIALGIRALRTAGFDYLGLSPSWVHVGKDGVARLRDPRLNRLSCALHAGDSPVDEAVALEWADFTPFEQIDHPDRLDERTEIYRLGVLLYYLASAKPLRKQPTAMAKAIAHRDQTAPALPIHRGEAARQINAVYRRMVANQPEDRFEDLGTLISELGLLREHLGGAEARYLSQLTTTEDDGASVRFPFDFSALVTQWKPYIQKIGFTALVTVALIAVAIAGWRILDGSSGTGQDQSQAGVQGDEQAIDAGVQIIKPKQSYQVE